MVPDKDVTVTIVIRTFNEGQHLERLLVAAGNQDVPFGFEVIVVDSGSTDQTVAIAKRYGARLVTITPEQFSFGFSLNKGIEAARGDYCVFVSGHCYPAHREWLANLIRPFSDPGVALVYGKQRGDSSTKYSEHQIFQKWFPDDGEGIQSLLFCNNANAAIRRDLWQEYRYNEAITGLEDIDWARGLVGQGYFIYYAPKAEVIHVHRETYRQIFRRYEREAIALHAMYPHDSFTFIDFIKLFSLNVVSDYLHALKEGSLLYNATGILAMRLCQFWGTYKGHNYLDTVSQGLKYKFYYPKKPGIYSKWENLKNGRATPKPDP
jgi:rhamnosyltransferase